MDPGGGGGVEPVMITCTLPSKIPGPRTLKTQSSLPMSTGYSTNPSPPSRSPSMSIPSFAKKKTPSTLPVPDTITPTSGSPVATRTKSPGFFEVFRRRSKSDSKHNQPSGDRGDRDGSSVGVTPSSSFSSQHHRRSFMSTLKSHIPWKDRRSSSMDTTLSTSPPSVETSFRDGRSSAVGTSGSQGSQGSHTLKSPKDPKPSGSDSHSLTYFTYTYGQEQFSTKKPSRLPRVMDLFRQRPDPAPSPLLQLNLNKRTLDFSDGDDDAMLFVKFFKHYRTYDLIPVSAKLIVFDTELVVKKAFYALVSNGVRAAPLWDSELQRFVGMLTITDFINILRECYTSPTMNMDELEDHKLSSWRLLLQQMCRPICTIGPDASLFEAIKTLIHEKVHRLPLVDPETGNVLYILTHKRILKFLFLYYNEFRLPRNLNQSVRDLGIGTYDNIATTTMDTPLIDVLHAFHERRVSAFPVIDDRGKVIDIYAKFDVINLAAERTYDNLDMTVQKALEYRNSPEGVVKCKGTDSLDFVLRKIVKAEVHRIVVVDVEDHVVGMISLSDILSFLALKPVALDRGSIQSVTDVSTTLMEESEEDEDEPSIHDDERPPSRTVRSSSTPIVGSLKSPSDSDRRIIVSPSPSLLPVPVQVMVPTHSSSNPPSSSSPSSPSSSSPPPPPLVPVETVDLGLDTEIGVEPEVAKDPIE